jgi:hypothetical protein
MKNLIFIVFFQIIHLNCLFSQNETIEDNSDIFKSIKVFYTDSTTNMDEKVYREFTYVGEFPYFSKPTIIDIVVELKDTLLSGVIEVFIENYITPDTLAIINCKNCKELTVLKPYWGLEQVVIHKHLSRKGEKLDKIEIKNVNHKTAYYTDSYFYGRGGFRIIVIYIPYNQDNIYIIDRPKDSEFFKREYFFNFTD